MDQWPTLIQTASTLCTFATTVINLLAAIRGRRGEVDR
jgi:hypothetical protein